MKVLRKRYVRVVMILLSVCFLVFSACATKTVLDDIDRYGVGGKKFSDNVTAAEQAALPDA